MRIKKTSQYMQGGASLSNEYGTSNENGYTQEYINGIIESGSNTNGNYIKYADGTMICTKTISGTLGGTAWGNIYYSDHTIGSWAETFTTLYYVNANVVPNQYWCNANGSNFEYVRVFRPNNGTTTGDIRLIAIGRWK